VPWTKQLRPQHEIRLSDRPIAEPDAAARKLLELAKAAEPVQDGRIYIKKINPPFPYRLKGTPGKYRPRLSGRLPMVGYGCTRAAPS
jgi:hypothetical protein